MSWLFFAIVARFLWACTNIIDQYLVRYVEGRSILVIMTIENLMTLPALIVLAYFTGIPIEIKPVTVLWLLSGALINSIALLPYFAALKHDEAHNAIPLMEMTPVILTILAYIVFDDKLNAMQFVGASLVIGGGFLFAWDFKHGRIRLKTALYMAACSLCFATYQLTLRYGAHEVPPWTVMLVMYVGYFAGFSILFAVMPKVRRQVFESVRRSKGKVLAYAWVEDCFAVLANLCLVTAFALAPKAGQVAALSATQPIFVLMITAVLGFLLPKHCPHLKWDWEMKIKCLLLLIITGGVVLLKAN